MMISLVKIFREEGAWWMALMCWACGWIAAWKLAWPPVLVAIITMLMMIAAPEFRTCRRLWTPDRKAAHRSLILIAIAGAVSILAAIPLLRHLPELHWLAVPVGLILMYALIIAAGKERHPLSRILAVAAITSLAPLTYVVTTGAIDRTAALLWSVLGGYFLLGAIFVMARFRRSIRALRLVRLLTPIAAAGLSVLLPWAPASGLLALPFVILAARAWMFRWSAGPLDPRSVGKSELVFGTLTTLCIAIGVSFR